MKSVAQTVPFANGDPAALHPCGSGNTRPRAVYSASDVATGDEKAGDAGHSSASAISAPMDATMTRLIWSPPVSVDGLL